MLKANTFKFGEQEFKELSALNTLIINHAPLFYDIAHKRRAAIYKIYRSVLNHEELPDDALEVLQNCVSEELRIRELLLPSFEKYSFLFKRNVTSGLNRFIKENNDSLYKVFTNFPTQRRLSLLSNTLPHVEKLFLVFEDYLAHLKKRSLYEFDLVRHKASASISELRGLWKEDLRIFEKFDSHLTSLHDEVSHFKNFGIFKVVLSGGFSLLMLVGSFMEPLNPKIASDFSPPVLFVASLLGFVVMAYNLALIFSKSLPDEKEEFVALKKIKHSKIK